MGDLEYDRQLPRASYEGLVFEINDATHSGTNGLVTDAILSAGTTVRPLLQGQEEFRYDAYLVSTGSNSILRLQEEFRAALRTTQGDIPGLLVDPWWGVQSVFCESWAFRRASSEDSSNSVPMVLMFKTATLPSQDDSVGVVAASAEELGGNLTELATGFADEPLAFDQLAALGPTLGIPDELPEADRAQVTSKRLYDGDASLSGTRLPAILHGIGDASRLAEVGDYTETARDLLLTNGVAEYRRSDSLTLASMLIEWRLFLTEVNAFGNTAERVGARWQSLGGDEEEIARRNPTAVSGWLITKLVRTV